MRTVGRFNRYDVWIMVLLASLAFCNSGSAINITRTLAILLIPLLITRLRLVRYSLMNYMVFWAFCLLYAAFSFLWTPDISEGFKTMIYFVVYGSLFIELLLLTKLAKRPSESIAKGWMIAVVITLVIAMWEITTDNHLSVSKNGAEHMRNMGGIIVQQKFASVTFYNTNCYVTFLCFAMPFVFYWISQIREISRWNVLSLAILLFSFIVIAMDASRGGILAVSVMTIIYLIRSKKNRYVVGAIILFCAVAAYVVINYGDVIFLIISGRLANSSMFEDTNRTKIWVVVLQVFKDTWGLGAGIGGLGKAMSQAWAGITIPHNMILEIMGGYGAVICLLFVSYLVSLFKRGVLSQDNSVKMLLFTALIPFPIYSIINSGYLGLDFMYASFACLSYYANSKSRNVASRLNPS